MTPILEPVVQMEFTPRASTPWPTCAHSPGQFVALSGNMSADEVGSVVLLLATYNAYSLFPDDESDDLVERFLQAPSREIIERLADPDVECLITPGGLRLCDPAAGAVVTPGCCCGLETWRKWLDLFTQEGFPWLGHDPEPLIEVLEEGEASGVMLRVWDNNPGRVHVDIPRPDLLALLEGVRQDLIGFLGALEAWAVQTVGREYAPAFAAAFDRHFQVTRTLK